MRVPWTTRRSNQTILKDISPEYSLEGLMLKFQYFGHLMRRADSLGKTLMLGKTEGGRRRGRQRMRWLDGITDGSMMASSMDMSLSKLWETVKDGSLPCGAQGDCRAHELESEHNKQKQQFWQRITETTIGKQVES